MVLENKLGITESAELAKEEERISKKKALELFEKNLLNSFQAGKFESLSKIHKYLFDEIYLFAGEIRNVNLFAITSKRSSTIRDTGSPS